MRFTAESIRDRFSEYVANWLSVAKPLRAARSLLFHSAYLPGGLENQFLNAVQSAEVFHKTRMDRTERPDEQHAALKASIIAAVPEESREWLKKKLQYSNEISLRERLRDLYAFVESAMRPLAPNAKGYVSDVVVARNDLVHRGRLKDASESALHALLKDTQRTEFMMQACFLRELGFSTAEVASMLSRDPRYAYLASNSEQS